MPAPERRPASVPLVGWSLAGATAALVAVTTAAVSWIVLAGTATVSPDVRSGAPTSASASADPDPEAEVVVVPPVAAWDGGPGGRRTGPPPVLAFRDDSAGEARSRKAAVTGAVPGSSPTALPSAVETPAPGGDPEAGSDDQPGRRPTPPSPDRTRPEPTPRPTTPAPARPQPDGEDRGDDRQDDRDDDRDRDDRDRDRGKESRDDRGEDGPLGRTSATPSTHDVPPGHLIGRGHAHHTEDGRGRGHHD